MVRIFAFYPSHISIFSYLFFYKYFIPPGCSSLYILNFPLRLCGENLGFFINSNSTTPHKKSGSQIPWFVSIIPIFLYSIIPFFHYSIIPLFHYSNIPFPSLPTFPRVFFFYLSLIPYHHFYNSLFHSSASVFNSPS